MWVRFMAALAALGWAGFSAAFAAETPQYGPAPAWVQPIEAPPASASNNRQPLRFLLVNEQTHFEPDAEERYAEIVTRIQTPDGLPVGNLTQTWDPQTDVLTVNKVRILRGDQVIDVLAPKADGAPGKTFTILRREANLESAMLDGRLTANLQLEDLRVGDVLDVAYTVRHHDPSFKGRPDATLFNASPLAVDRLYLRALWPTTLPVRWRKTDGLSDPKLTKTGAQTELLVDMVDAKPPKPPKLAPRRFSDLGRLQVSAYASWTDVSKRLAPLFIQAAKLDAESGLKAEAARIRALSQDPHLRASEAMKLVEEKVRYVFLAQDLGGYKPAAADLTWARRFGDCKGKSVLLVALLRELGLDAETVLVSTTDGDGMDERLPSLSFDHAIVRLKLDGRIYWLDATRTGDVDIARLDPPPYRWALPLTGEGADLTPIDQPPLATPRTVSFLRLDARQGLTAPASARVEVIHSGDAALGIDRFIRATSKADLETLQRNYWRSEYPWITIKTLAFFYDPATGEAHEVMEGLAQLDWSAGDAGRGRRFRIPNTGLGRAADFKRDPDTRMDAPYAVGYPAYTTGEITVILPDGGRGFRLEGRDVDRTVGGVQYQRSASIKDGVAVVSVSTRALVREFPANAAYTTQLGLAALTSEGLWVRAPVTYNPSKQELSGVSALEPTTTEDYFKRAAELAGKWETERALADYAEVLRREPAMPGAHIGRGLLYMRKGEVEKALADFDAALAAQPDNLAALYARSQARLAARKPDLALADADTAVRFAPNFVDAYDNRALLFMRLHAPEKALADYNRILALNPESLTGLLGRSRAYMALGRPALAQVDLDAVGESANILNERCFGRAVANVTLNAALAECDAAVRLAPAADNILDSRGFTRFRLGDFKGALADFDAALALNPKRPETLFARGLAKRRLGDHTGGDADLAAAKAMDAEAVRTFADYGLTQ